MDKLVVLILCYNEERTRKTISKVVTDFKETLQSRRLSFDRADDRIETKFLGHLT